MEQREIKFRVFENENARGRMFEWDDIKTDFISYLNCNDTFLMQYTGLKDKNGKEIYEGDIIKQYVIRDESYTQECEIFFKDGCFYARGCGLLRDFNDNIRPCEIIGNIYQNKI